jgi:hypothetical protein
VHGSLSLPAPHTPSAQRAQQGWLPWENREGPLGVGLETPQEPHGLLAGVRSLGGGGGGDGGRVGTAQGT